MTFIGRQNRLYYFIAKLSGWQRYALLTLCLLFIVTSWWLFSFKSLSHKADIYQTETSQLDEINKQIDILSLQEKELLERSKKIGHAQNDEQCLIKYCANDGISLHKYICTPSTKKIHMTFSSDFSALKTFLEKIDSTQQVVLQTATIKRLHDTYLESDITFNYKQ